MPQPPLPDQTWRANETHCHDDKLMSERTRGYVGTESSGEIYIMKLAD